MSVRYDQKKKKEVVAFVETFNVKNGRGGQSAAAKKFRISPITIASWLKKAGGDPAVETKGAMEKKGTSGGVKVAAISPVASPVSAVLKRMTLIQEQIESLQGEYQELKKKL